MRVVMGRAAAICAAIMLVIGQPQAQTAKAPQPHNRFVTVDEFIRGKRAVKTLVSVEGYILVAVRSAGGVARLSLVDSTDKVLSARDADLHAASGATCLAALKAGKKAGWVLSRAGLLRYAMYTGARRAETSLQDTPPKMRLTGTVAKGRGTIGTVTKIEYQDMNGDWKEARRQ